MVSALITLAGRPDLSPYLVRMLLLCVATIHSMPYIPGTHEHATTKTWMLIAGSYLPEIINMMPPATLASIVPSKQPSTTAMPGGGVPAAARRVGSKGKGKGRPASNNGSGSKGEVGQAGSSGKDQPVSVGREHQQQQYQQQQHAVLTGTKDEEACPERSLTNTLDLRGLVHTCLCTIARGCQIALAQGRPLYCKWESHSCCAACLMMLMC
jgi:hypothetical protein